MAKKKAEKIDGWGPKEKMQVRNAVRLVWQRSRAWKKVKDRCKGEDGFSYCELCKQKSPRVAVDHKVAIGDIEEPGFLERLFISSDGLQGICDSCHKIKSKKDNFEIKEKKKKRKENKLETFL